MNDKIISFETAKLAKEKGFDSKIDNWYRIIDDSDRKLYGRFAIRGGLVPPISQSLPIALAPTQGLLQKWLRDVHKINVELNLNFCVEYSKEFGYGVSIMTNCDDFKKVEWIGTDLTGKWHKNYEDALEAGLKQALELIK